MSKIVENDKNLLKDALAEYNAIKEEAIKVAKNRLAKSMPDVIENFLKEEIEKSMAEEGVISTEGGMTKTQESSVMETMKDVDSPVSEGDDMHNEEDHMEEMEEDVNDDELTAEAIEEALKEMEEMDIEEGMYEEDMHNEGMYEEDENLDEHNISFEVDFDDEKLGISNIKSDKKEFDDVEFELELEDDMEDMDSEDEMEGMDSEDDMDSEEFSLDDLDLDSLEDEEEDVEESLAHTITHQNARGAGSHNHVNYEKSKRLRPAMQESAMKKDIDKLIKENEELRSINVDFKDALKKYKTQLYEMAVFNANLSHVNNLFVEHSTTVDEKKDILSKFKSVATIDESKNVYNTFVKTLNESKVSKKTIEEMIEKPSTGDSGSKELNESLNPKTKDNDSVKAIQYMMNYIENRK